MSKTILNWFNKLKIHNSIFTIKVTINCNKTILQIVQSRK